MEHRTDKIMMDVVFLEADCLPSVVCTGEFKGGSTLGVIEQLVIEVVSP